MGTGKIMRVLFILSILYFISIPAEATVQVLRWPSNVPISVCVPFDTNPGCGGGGGGASGDFLLEDSSYLLLENGVKITL